KRKDSLAILLKEALGGKQVFWVVPQIGASKPRPAPNDDPDIFQPAGGRHEEDVASVDKIKAELSAYSKEWKVGVVHGRLVPEKKEAALAAFGTGEQQGSG